MPLIKHSEAFLKKQAALRAVKAEKKAAEIAEKNAQAIANYYEQVKEFKDINIPEEPAAREKYEVLLNSLVNSKIPILEFLTLDESKFLHEIFRFARLSGNFTKTLEGYRMMENLTKKNQLNIFHLQQIEDLGLGPYYRKYSGVKNKALKVKTAERNALAALRAVDSRKVEKF